MSKISPLVLVEERFCNIQDFKHLKEVIILGGYGDGVVIASALDDLRASGQALMPYGFLSDHEPKGNSYLAFKFWQD